MDPRPASWYYVGKGEERKTLCFRHAILRGSRGEPVQHEILMLDSAELAQHNADKCADCKADDERETERQIARETKRRTDILRDIGELNNGGRGARWSDLIQRAEARGESSDATDALLNLLMDEAVIYEPVLGRLVITRPEELQRK